MLESDSSVRWPIEREIKYKPTMRREVQNSDGSQNEQATTRLQETLNAEYSQQEQNLEIFDFTNKPELARQLVRLRHIAKKYYAEKLHRLGLSTRAVMGIKTRYVIKDSLPEGKGYTNKNGLVVVMVDENNSLLTAQREAHEMSHESSGFIERGFSSFQGLSHRNFFSLWEGSFLEESMANWDATDIYHLWKDKNVLPISSLPTDNSQDSEYKGAVEELQRRGVPSSLMEPYSDVRYVMEVAAIWRIARLLGTTNSAIPLNDNDALVAYGREILEQSRYRGNVHAHRLIKKLLGRGILYASDHPKNFRRIFAALDSAEERRGIVNNNNQTSQ